jgi:glutamine cyclotransferase
MKLVIWTFSFVLAFFILFLNFSCSDSKSPGEIEYYTLEIINSYPHDTKAFTQGLVFEDGFLYESTGNYKNSSLRKVELKTGNILKIHKLSDKFFGEGITIFGDKIIQLTWKENTGFVYDKNTFDLLETFTYSNEGWGITHDGRQFIMSDGSSKLYFLNPQTYKKESSIVVMDDIGPLTHLNELEYIDGNIYANIWSMDHIAKINPDTGKVTAFIDLTALRQNITKLPGQQVLNGIAYDSDNDRFFVTGKFWSKIFEIKMVRIK